MQIFLPIIVKKVKKCLFLPKIQQKVYIQSIYIVNVAIFAFLEFYVMGILWVLYGYLMVHIAQ